MSIETAYTALRDLLQETLQSTGFLGSGQDLELDPESPFAPSGDETDIISAAALVKVKTGPVRQLLGRAADQPRYVVERECRLELAIAGPSRANRLAIDAETLTTLALLPAQHPTLGELVERFNLTEQTDDELPPNGVATFVTFTLRIRSGDPLGRTA